MIYIPVVAVIAATWHSFVALHGQWTDWADTTHTHGYLIATISAWLLWRNRVACREISISFALWRSWPLVIAMTCWLFFVMAGIQAAELVLVPVVLWCAMYSAFGWRVARNSAFSAGYLLFATPVWDALNGLFQWSSVYAVRGLLRALDVPSRFDENFVHIPAGTFEIAGGCSGLHFVVVGAAIAALMGELRRDGIMGRIKLLLLAVGLAMLANWMRIVIIVEAGHLTNMQHYLVASSHYGFGWAVFAVCMAIFFWLESRMSASRSPASARSAASSAQPFDIRRWCEVSLAVVPLLGLLMLWHALAVRPATSRLVVPPLMAGWSIESGAPEGWQPKLAGVDESVRQRYRREDGKIVDVYYGLYRFQSQGKEFSAYGNDLYPGMRMVDQDSEVIAGMPFMFQRFRGQAGNEKLVAASYRVGKRAFAHPARAQLWYALKAMLQLRSPVSRVLLLHTDCQPDCGAARDVLRERKEGS